MHVQAQQGANSWNHQAPNGSLSLNSDPKPLYIQVVVESHQDLFREEVKIGKARLAVESAHPH